MACVECGLEQAAAGAGACARCGAALPGAEHPSGAFAGPGGAVVPRADGSGIHVRGSCDARARLISWEEIGWFRDGWHAPESGKPGWMLHIVLADGRVERVTGTWTAGAEQAPANLLALIRRATAEHSVPAVLTGGQVHDGLPGEDAGLYHDPAGEPGLREWTGTEWSPFLQVGPAAGGHPGQETGLAKVWSPLSAGELHRQSREIQRGSRNAIRLYAFVFVPALAGALWLAVGEELLGGSPDPPIAAFFGALGMVGLILWVVLMLQERASKRIALALSAAATRALMQDDAPSSIKPPDLPVKESNA